MTFETLDKAMRQLEDVALTVKQSANRIEEYVGRLESLLQDGYGGNGSILIELLTNLEINVLKEQKQ